MEWKKPKERSGGAVAGCSGCRLLRFHFSLAIQNGNRNTSTLEICLEYG